MASAAPLVPLNRRQCCSGAGTTTLIARRQFNFSAEQAFIRCFNEIYAASAPKVPSVVGHPFDRQENDFFSECKFVFASPTGDHILGVWMYDTHPCEKLEYIVRYNIQVDGKKAREQTTYGLVIEPMDIMLKERVNVQDMRLAKMDDGVTCVLYLMGFGDVFLQPDISVPEFPTSPIFEANNASSCCLEPRHMRASLGLSNYCLVLDILSKKHFRIDSQNKIVFTECFSADGNLLFMGLRQNDILCSDLRSRYTILALNQFDTCFLHLMRDENYLMSFNYDGQVLLWDIRQKRVVQNFLGVEDGCYDRTPVIFNEEETVGFGTDRKHTVHCWSLKTGRTLAKIPDPGLRWSSYGVPRLCYSDRWGGRFGNAAMCWATRDSINFYEMTL